jgi:hypothetical protein
MPKKRNRAHKESDNDNAGQITWRRNPGWSDERELEEAGWIDWLNGGAKRAKSRRKK